MQTCRRREYEVEYPAGYQAGYQSEGIVEVGPIFCIALRKA